MTRPPLPELRDQAKGRWRSILSQLGVDASFFDGRQRPCPICGGKDRARFDDIGGHGTWICNHCGAGNGISLAMKVTGLAFPDLAVRVREMLPDAPVSAGKAPRDDTKCWAEARRVWVNAVPIGGTMAEAYLRSRGAWSDHLGDGEALRFVPTLRATKHEAGYLPAMVARVSDPTGAGVNVHRTFLHEGRKVYRAMMPGAVPEGSAIRLFPSSERLGVAEGIETSLRAAHRFGVPTWSAITAGGMERWDPPAGTAHLDVFGDSDHSFAGQASAYILARKLTNRPAPIVCAVHLPDALGTDWADANIDSARAA